ncbi:MAG: squalene/phytoene synthase family protein [Anaerolineales bacterium]|nr:squalene/phytoene synthase family protein [Anaerolineales bacterium]
MSHMVTQAEAIPTWNQQPPFTLDAAYRYCDDLTRHHSKSFYFATRFLPAEKRQAIRALYAFCRWTDDIVDEPTNEPSRDFARWSETITTPLPRQSNNPVLIAWRDTRERYALPQAVIDELIAGVRMDLSITRYTTFDDLWLYCYRVAATVGLLSMHIIGYEAGADPYAIRLGVALQLTNILRDVGEDARRGRIYLPQEELAQFGLSDDDILAHRLDDRYRQLMIFQIERAERLYDEAWPGIALLHKDGRMAVASAATVYRAILPALRANHYDNFSKRAFVPTARKLAMLPQIWWSTR